LTHAGVAPTTAGKVIDLGFNGDFDVKKTDWNTVFVQFPAKAGGTEMTVSVYTVQSGISGIVATGNKIGEIVVSAASVQKGGVVGIPMPRNLKRYFTLGITGTTIPATVTAGITDVVDTDLDFNWTNYKAQTGSSEVEEVRVATTKDLAEHADAETGVHGK
jgi:hypothetical protein